MSGTRGKAEAHKVVELSTLEEAIFHTDYVALYSLLGQGTGYFPKRLHTYATDETLLRRRRELRIAVNQSALHLNAYDCWVYLVYALFRIECAAEGGVLPHNKIPPLSKTIKNPETATRHMLASYAVGLYPASVLDVPEYRCNAVGIRVSVQYHRAVPKETVQTNKEGMYVLGGILKQLILANWLDKYTVVSRFAVWEHNEVTALSPDDRETALNRLVGLCREHAGSTEMDTEFTAVKYALMGNSLQAWQRFSCPCDHLVYYACNKYNPDGINELNAQTDLDCHETLVADDRTSLAWVLSIYNALLGILRYLQTKDVDVPHLLEDYQCSEAQPTNLYLNPITHTLWYCTAAPKDGQYEFVELAPGDYASCILAWIYSLKEGPFDNLYRAIYASPPPGSYLFTILKRL